MIVQSTFGAVKKKTSDSAAHAAYTGMADDLVAAAIGCPDQYGMAELAKTNPTYHSICYTAKRPLGKVILIGGLVGLYFLFKPK